LSTIKLTDFNRLKKLLMLAANNQNEHEAIGAFRAATEIVRTHGYTWEQVMDRRVMVVSEVEFAAEEEPGALVPPVPGTTRRVVPSSEVKRLELDESDFEMAMRDARGPFLDTLTSIHEQWERTGRLSPRQRQVILDAAERAAERHPGGRVR
jgi:hypothetical protein